MGWCLAMKVMVYARPGEMRIEERPFPAVVPGEVVLRVKATGICGSDLHGYLGHDRTRAPGMILGHEFSGVVVASGEARFAEGMLVTSNSAFTCGHCDYCVQGRDNLCASRRSLGKHRQGGYAEFIAVPASALIDVPQDIDPVMAALTEPTANGVHAINLSARAMARPVMEAKTLVLGGGAIGFLAALVMKAHGCRDLTLAEINPLRRAMVAAHVGCTTYDPRESEPPAGDFDFVLNAVGSNDSVAASLKAVRSGGVIAQIGLHDQTVSLDIQRLTRAQITLIGVANYPTMELRASARLLRSGQLGDLSWVELRPFEEGPRAFEDLAAGVVASPKIILLPDAARLSV